MPKARMTLSIGYAGAVRNEVIDIDETEWEDCETEQERDDLLHSYWMDWSNNFIDGSSSVIVE